MRRSQSRVSQAPPVRLCQRCQLVWCAEHRRAFVLHEAPQLRDDFRWGRCVERVYLRLQQILRSCAPHPGVDRRVAQRVRHRPGARSFLLGSGGSPLRRRQLPAKRLLRGFVAPLRSRASRLGELEHGHGALAALPRLVERQLRLPRLGAAHLELRFRHFDVGFGFFKESGARHRSGASLVCGARGSLEPSFRILHGEGRRLDPARRRCRRLVGVRSDGAERR
mmetsp:Transcript_860/g.3166  ORF Transcript_860/g.3166 Transcript_860/m.3166 type:complete len:223 (-) Transcript_860:295-963(-)